MRLLRPSLAAVLHVRICGSLVAVLTRRFSFPLKLTHPLVWRLQQEQKLEAAAAATSLLFKTDRN